MLGFAFVGENAEVNFAILATSNILIEFEPVPGYIKQRSFKLSPSLKQNKLILKPRAIISLKLFTQLVILEKDIAIDLALG